MAKQSAKEVPKMAQAAPQTVPGAPPPAPPSGPAAPAAKSKPKKGLDLSGLSDEARAKVEALRKSLAEERKKTSTALAEKEKRELAALGVTLPDKPVRKPRDTGMNGLNMDLKVSVPASQEGWVKDADARKAIEAANGNLTLKQLNEREDVGGWPWVRQKFVRNQLLINGKTFTDIVNKGAA